MPRKKPMYIQGNTLRGFVRLLDPGALIEVRDETRKPAELADLPRIRELVDRDHVGGIATGAKLRYLVLKVPVEQAARRSVVERAGFGCIGQDSRTIHSGDDVLALAYLHDFRACASYGPLARAVTSGPAGSVKKQSAHLVKAACETLGAGIC
jgi:hypothetical protein